MEQSTKLRPVQPDDQVTLFLGGATGAPDGTPPQICHMGEWTVLASAERVDVYWSDDPFLHSKRANSLQEAVAQAGRVLAMLALLPRAKDEDAAFAWLHREGYSSYNYGMPPHPCQRLDGVAKDQHATGAGLICNCHGTREPTCPWHTMAAKEGA